MGEIDLQLNVNQSTFNKQVQGLASSAKTPIVNAFKPIGKLIGGALAIGSIVKFTKSCLDLGSDLTEVQNVVDTTFKTMSSQVNDFAANAMTGFGMSETVAKQYMGTLGAMSKSMGFSEQASFDMAEAITGLTGDVASFYNLSTDEAFNKLKSIWTGETESLKSIGVLLTQTNLDQYALNHGFAKTTASMTEQEKVMLRYQYTISALSDASGDFAKTSGSWANQTRILSLQFDSLKATLGQGFINLFTPIIRMINALLSKLQVLAQQFKAFTEMLMGNRGDAGSGVANIATDADKAVTGLKGVTGAAKKAAKATGLLGIDELNVVSSGNSSQESGAGVPAAGTDIDMGSLAATEAAAEVTTGKLCHLLELAKDTGKKIMSFLSDSFGGNVGTAFEKIKESVFNFCEVFVDALEDCKTFGKPFLNWLTGDFVTHIQAWIDQIGTVISGLMDSFSKVFSDIWNICVYPILMNFLEVGLPILTQFGTELVESGTELFNQFKRIFDLLWSEGVAPALELIKQIWLDLMGSLQTFWNTYGQPIFENFKLAIQNIGDTLQNVWTNILKPVWDNLMNVIDEFWTNHMKPLVDELLSFIGELVNGALEIYNQFISPIVNWLVEVLGPVVSNVFNTIINVLGTVFGAVADVVGGVIKALKGIIEFITGIFTGNWEKAWQGICDFFGGIWDGIIGLFKGIINIFIDLINGLIGGIVGGVNGIIRALNKIHIDVPQWVTDLTGLTSLGFNLTELTPPQIPRLAQGGYVGANQPQLAMIGDNKHEGEIVSPESKLLEMAVKAAELTKEGNTDKELLITIIELLRAILDKDTGITDNDIFRSVKRSTNEYYKRTGRPAFQE